MKGFDRLAEEIEKASEPPVLHGVMLTGRSGAPEAREAETRSQSQAITFLFDRMSAHVICDSERGEIELLVGEELPWSDAVSEDISEESPWDDVVGMALAFAWNLTNNRGFGDAIQFRFLEEEEEEDGAGEVETLQIEALETELKITRLEADGWTYDPADFFADD